MRLINTKTKELKEFWGSDIPRYAILSHTWEEEEVTFQQFAQLPQEDLLKFKGHAKIEQICRLARRSRIDWAWVDTCCIDKSSSAELTEAINSMFRWYQESAACFAYLSDLKSIVKKREKGEVSKDREWKNKREEKWLAEGEDAKEKQGRWSKDEGNGEWKDSDEKPRGGGGKSGDEWKKANGWKNLEQKGNKLDNHKESDAKSEASSLTNAQSDSGLSFTQRVERYGRCRWFTRGWTLQELIAPRRVGFYNQDWEFEGEKEALSDVLAEITRINKRVLGNAALLSTIPVAQRMSWAANRQTTRAEDMAYCLLGIFGVQIPMLYGEGSKAFIRLQEEIIKESNDLSLFAWRTKATSQKHWGILALSPKDFADCTDIELWDDPMYNDEFVVTSKGLRVTPTAGGGLRSGRDATHVLDLRCYRQGSNNDLGIFLRQHGCDIYTRVFPDALSETRGAGREVDEAKGRMFYISKIVSPVLSIVLGSSHRNAIDMTRATEALRKADFYLQKRSINPAGHWDVQRNLFLTQGMREFACRLAFKSRSDRELVSLELDCKLRDGKPSVRFIIESSPGRFARGTVLQKQGGRGEAVDWLRVTVTEESINGQPVHFVGVDVLA